MKTNLPSRTFGLLVGAFLTAFPARGQIQLHSLAPEHGPAGTPVVLSGAGFPASGGLVVRVGGVNAPVLERTPGLIRFSVPAAAATGPVEAVFDGATAKFPTPFIVTRLVAARIAPEARIVASSYTVGTLYSDAPGTGPNYGVEVATREATLVGASAGENDPVLLAMATDATGEVVLSAQSTALTMLYLFPGIQTLDHDEAARRLEFLAGLPETTALAGMIQSRLDTGREYLDLPALEGTLIAGVEAFLAGYTPPAPEPAAVAAPAQFAAARAPGGGNDFVEGIFPLASGYPRDLETPGYEKLRRLATVNRGTGVSARGLPIIKVEVKSAPLGAGPEALRQYVELNPLDWMANLYELNPADADLDTPAKARNLRGDFANMYERLGADAIDRMHVKAKLAFRFADLLELTTDFLLAPVSSPLVAKEHLEIPADRPGLYLIRAYSGARFPPQRTLLNTLPDGRYEDYTMTALNMILAATDLLGFSLKEGLSECRSKFLVSLLISTSQTVDREAAAGTLSSEAITRLFLHTARSYVKDYVLKCMILDKDREGLSQVGKVFIKNIDALGKLASLGKVAERLTALGNLIGATGEPQRIWMAQAIEDTLIVVGNPWQPRVTGFFPQSGYRGATVRINGVNFNPATNLNIVTFGVLGTDPTNPPAAARAEVLAAAATSLLVRVPENALSGVISVTVAGKGTATTAGLRPPFQTFEVLADPVITRLTPNPPVAGQVMLIHGSNFARITDRQELVFAAGPAQTVVGSPNLIGVRAPNSTAPNSIKVRINGRESNVLPFTAVLPGNVSTGAVIYVSTHLDNTAEDGELTLREAILLAGGGTTALGRALTTPPLPPNPRPPGATYETDFVSVPSGSPGPGVGTKDFVVYTSAMIGQTVMVGTPLPPLQSHDDYDLEFYIDGGGGAGDGIRLLGAGVQFHANLIRNFSGNGILLSGAASDNVIRDTIIEQCGGDGVRLEGNALANTLINLGIYECGHGLRLSGPGVQLNRSELNEISDNRGFGILIEDSAYWNEVIPYSVYSNGAGGIRVTGAGTTANVIRGLRAFSESGVIHGNGGPGIWIDSPLNILRALNVAGNLGDGILLEGPLCRDVQITDTRSGYDDWAGVALANQGSGLHIRGGSHRIIVGTTDGDISNADIANVNLMNCFAGNRDHGIRIEGTGTSNIWINSTIVGAAATLRDLSVAMPNGTHGIAVIGGARRVTIGNGGVHANVVVANHTNGAGIYLAQTADNFIVACKIGRDDVIPGRLGNRYGIHLAQNAHANWIGFQGFRQLVRIDGNLRTYDERNYFFGNFGAAILLESGGDPARTLNEGEVPDGGNVIQNNRFGSIDVAGLENHIGLLLRQGAVINRIESNDFLGNTQAGLLIDGAVISRPFLANRIIRNTISRQGLRVASPGDPLDALPAGVGVALINGASGHVIGGNGFWEANEISDNHVGVQMAQCESNRVTGNRIYRNRAGGVVVLESGGNTIGPENQIFRNGTVAASYGGVAIKTSFDNAVLGNWIGLEAADTIATGKGNRHFGIGVFDSIGNVLGDIGARNIIVGHTNGVVLSGFDSLGNQVANNYIGLSPVPGVFTTGNTRAGVLLTNGASQNVIGGTRPWQAGQAVLPHMTGNVIHRNSVDGVRVDGVGTVGNSILYNSIADHSGGLGIDNVNLGNIEIPPPTLVSHNGLNVLGAVHSSIPDGSRVQFFWDTADEGKFWMGEELVTGGQFRFVIPGIVPLRINATVTHAFQGDTSEFAPLILRTNLTAGLMIHRVSQPPTNTALPWPGPVGVAVAFRLRAFGQPILITTLAFKTTGSANEALPGTQAFLFRDENQDSRLTQTDFLFAGPRTFATNDANLTFTTLGRVIEPLADQHWLLVLLPSTGATNGQTYAFEIPAENFITSRSLLTGEAVTETGEFPLFSDTLVLTPNPTPPAGFQIRHGPDGSLTLDWMGGGLLESGPTVLGPWTLIPDAATPFRVEPERPQEFFRFRP